MNRKSVRRVAILGAGTMGSRIAAHFANAGIPALLLDVVRPGQANRNQAALSGLESASKQKPVAFFTQAAAALVTPGNFEDRSERHPALRLDYRSGHGKSGDQARNCSPKLPPRARPAPSSPPIPAAFRSPPSRKDSRRNSASIFWARIFSIRHAICIWSKLIRGAETAPEVLEFVADFCDRRLGKGVVPCKDTPNFIANRIGVFFGATIHKITVEDDYSIEEVDALTGPLIGLPKSASYRLLDIIGLDVWALVTHNLYELAPDDPWRERFVLQPFLAEMILRGWLGEKKGQGCYKRVGKGANQQIHAIDRKTLEYHPAQKPRFPSVEAAKNVDDLGERLRTLVAAEDRAGAFLWKLLSDLFIYSATMTPENFGSHRRNRPRHALGLRQ